jgi:predicted N-acetyltransferase YhbS
MAGRAAEQGTDARDQFVGVERLDEVVVGARLQAAHAVGDLAARREHQRRGVDALLPELLDHLEAVPARQAHVEDDQIRFVCLSAGKT